jgi:hypothetical protein
MQQALSAFLRDRLNPIPSLNALWNSKCQRWLLPIVMACTALRAYIPPHFATK